MTDLVAELEVNSIETVESVAMQDVWFEDVPDADFVEERDDYCQVVDLFFEESETGELMAAIRHPDENIAGDIEIRAWQAFDVKSRVDVIADCHALCSVTFPGAENLIEHMNKGPANKKIKEAVFNYFSN